VTRAAFLVRHPEFADAEAALVEAKLAEAERRTPSRVWGDLEDDGIASLAAHLLAISPNGQMARLVNKDGTTTYGTLRDELVETVGGSHRIVT
jgi:hypothetical protein